MTRSSEQSLDQPWLSTVGTVYFPFLRALGHELNSPLTGIMGYAQLLAESLPADSPDREDVQEILRCAEHCRDLVQILGRFSRPESGVTECDPGSVLSDLECLGQAVARKHGVELQVDTRGRLPLRVKANPWALRAGLLALCGYAVSASTPKGTAVLLARGDQSAVKLELRCPGEGTGRGPLHPDRLGSLEEARKILEAQGIPLRVGRDAGKPLLEVELPAAEL